MGERVRGLYSAETMSIRAAKNAARAAKIASHDPGRAREIVRRSAATVLHEADAVIEEARRAGAAAPAVERAVKTSFRVTVAPTPHGSNAAPAWVVRFDGSAPIERLSRGEDAPLGPLHVSAARRLAVLHARALAPPALTASYDGPRARGRAEWSDERCDAWDAMRDGLRALLPVEARVVLAVVVYDTPVADLARAGVVTIRKTVRAEAAIVQTLALGLERLALTWGLDAGAPRES
jgi:hypothetical protein